MSRIWVFLVLCASCALAQEAPVLGLAANYPGDIGIESDPSVLLFDDFENYTQPSDTLQTNGGKWNEIQYPRYCRIDTLQHFRGSKSFEIAFPIVPYERAIHLHREVSPIEPILFMRAYMRYGSNFYLQPQSSHKGIGMNGRYPGPGHAPPRDGSGFFLFGLENTVMGQFRVGEQEPGYGHIYAYWPYQCSNYGDNWYPPGTISGCISPWLAYPNLYPDFVPRPNYNVPRGQWFCYELMVKVNDLDRRNGEVKVWLNGNVVMDFPDLFIRSIPDLQIDAANLGFHAHHSERVNKIWWDNVVLARQYIGP